MTLDGSIAGVGRVYVQKCLNLLADAFISSDTIRPDFDKKDSLSSKIMFLQ